MARASVCRSRSGANRNSTEAAPQRAGRGRARAGDTNTTTTAARGGRGRARGAARGTARRGGRAARPASPQYRAARMTMSTSVPSSRGRAPARRASPQYRAARMTMSTSVPVSHGRAPARGPNPPYRAARMSMAPTISVRPVRAGVVGQPAVPANFIHMLLQNVMRERNDPNGDPANVYVINSDEADSDDSDILDSSSSPSDSEDEDVAGGPLHRDANHIRQPIFDEDQAMYQRELRLYHDDTEFQVPPAQVPTDKGQPIEPDGTWGDCTMCSNTPVKPQGCNKCLQILGCAHCIKRWHQARKQSTDGPSCPLCRNPWTARPKTSAMKTIDAKKKKLEAKEAAASSSSASAVATD